MLLTLTACGTSGPRLDQPVPPQAVPVDLRTCFDRLVPKPAQQTMTARELMSLIAALKRSELEKSQCGKRLLQFVSDKSEVMPDRPTTR